MLIKDPSLQHTKFQNSVMEGKLISQMALIPPSTLPWPNAKGKAGAKEAPHNFLGQVNQRNCQHDIKWTM